MTRLGVWWIAAAAGLAACEPASDVPEAAVRDSTLLEEEQPAPEERIEVQLMDSVGQQVGVAHFTPQDNGGTEVHVRVTGLAPNSEHGFHVHETGSCEAPTFESAGGHFNPTGAQHGMENPEGPHVGDMPNIRAGQDGVAEATFVQQNLQLRGDSTALQQPGGLAVVVHEGSDDERTDPSGDAGPRIACGVLRIE